jgi:small Trp-rich protein
MYLLGLGLLLVVLRLAEFGVVAQWSWLVVLTPFAAAVVWWTWADASGYTKRREVDKMNARVSKRREDNLEALGMGITARRAKKRR